MNPGAVAKEIRVVLVEDHGIVRAGVEAVIGTIEGFRLVGTVESGGAAMPAIANLHPDVVILDVHLPDISGLEVLRRLRAQAAEVAVLILTSSDSDHTVSQAFALGARGYCLKREGTEALVSALKAVAQGRKYVSGEASNQLLAHLETEALNAREVEVLRLASLGLSNRQIGQELGVGERTVKFHFTCVFQKLDAADRTAAVTIAIRRGLLDQ